MAPRLTDRQKKRIIADYVNLGSYNAVGKMHGISATTVKNLVQKDAGTVEKCEQKKKQNTMDMLAYMDSKKKDAQGVIDAYLKALADPEKLEEASLSQIATAMGIVVDKFTKNTYGGNDSMNKLDGLLREFRDAVKSEAD